MTQATLERPAAKRPAGKASAKSTNPREKIIWQLTELQAGIAEIVESEDGDCLGRVLDHAGQIVTNAAEFFAASDSDASYYLMVEAVSFIQAAAALAADEETQKSRLGNRGQPGRSAEARRLAVLSDAIATAQDQRLTDIASGKTAAITPALESEAEAVVPIAPPPGPPAAPATDADEFDNTARLYGVRAVLLMLIRTFGGEIPEGDRPKDEDIVRCIQFINRVVSGISAGADASDGLRGDFYTAISDCSGIAQSLDTVTWADGMQIMGSDEMMSGIFGAMDLCICKALRALNREVA